MRSTVFCNFLSYFRFRVWYDAYNPPVQYSMGSVFSIIWVCILVTSFLIFMGKQILVRQVDNIMMV